MMDGLKYREYSRSPYSFSSNSSRGLQEFFVKEHKFSQIQRNVHNTGYVAEWQRNNFSTPFNRGSLKTVGFFHNRKYLPHGHNQRSNYTGDINQLKGHEAGIIKKNQYGSAIAQIHLRKGIDFLKLQNITVDQRQATERKRHGMVGTVLKRQMQPSESKEKVDEMVKGFKKDKDTEKLDGKGIMSAVSPSLLGISVVKTRHEHKMSLVLNLQ